MIRYANRNTISAVVVLVAAVAFSPAPAAAQATGNAAVEPAATAALDAMGVYLRTLKVFQVEAVTARDTVLDNGLKAQRSGHTTVLARLPDRLYVDTTGDRQRRYYYNGKEFTLYAPGRNLYATANAPATLGELATTLEDKYDIELPLVDLFRWGASGAASTGITAAADLGAASVDGTTCQHYAFRSEGLDWQVWIQKGDFPLPRRLVLTTTTDEARPQFEVTYTWNLAPSFNDAAFSFDPPAGAQKIVFAAEAGR